LILISNIANAWDIKTNNAGQALHWKTTDIHYAINADGTHGLTAEAVDTAISQAATAWNQGPTQMIFDGDTKKTGADYSDGVHSIVFQDNWTEDPSVLAITYTWSTADGEIVHFDMEINAEDHEWSTNGDANKQDLMNALTHEFGHAVGLDHSEDISATMAPDALLGETSKRDLNQDDLEGYHHIYDSQGNGLNTGNSGNSGSNGGGGVSGSHNNHGQTGQGMVPLDNAGCASANSNGDYGLWSIIVALGLLIRRKT
jgi:hypothetical protein